MTYDYEAIHRAVCPDPDTLTMAQRNRAYPDANDMITFLSLLHSEAFIEGVNDTPVNPAYYSAKNNGLLSDPIVKWSSGSRYISHRLTEKGRAYLCYLKVITFKPKPQRALAVIQPRALVVLGHFERLTDTDFIRQAQDAEYTAQLFGKLSLSYVMAGL